jgi:hypothetical protein
MAWRRNSEMSHNKGRAAGDLAHNAKDRVTLVC